MIKMKWNFMKHCILKAARNLIRKSSISAYAVIPYGLLSRHRGGYYAGSAKFGEQVSAEQEPCLLSF